jgi:uncharacterized repeat protein (TIGR01451 family)
VVGDRLTYTIQMTNEGAIAITEAVVADVYNPAYLAFVTSTPTLPTFIDTQNGVITWTTLASPALQPGQGISLTVVFEVLQDGEAVNRAELVSASDFFGNDLAAGSGEVGIIIIDDSTGTTTTNDDDDDDDDEITAPAGSSVPAAPAATATPAAQGVTGPNAPTQLPETGRLDPNRPVFGPVLTLLVLLTVTWVFFRMRNNSRK